MARRADGRAGPLEPAGAVPEDGGGVRGPGRAGADHGGGQRFEPRGAGPAGRRAPRRRRADRRGREPRVRARAPTSACAAGSSTATASGRWSHRTTRCPAPAACGPCSTRSPTGRWPAWPAPTSATATRRTSTRYFGGITMPAGDDVDADGWQAGRLPARHPADGPAGLPRGDRGVRRAVLRVLRGGRPRHQGPRGRVGGRHRAHRGGAQPVPGQPGRGRRLPHAPQHPAARARALRSLQGVHPLLHRARGTWPTASSVRTASSGSSCRGRG